MPSTQLSQTTLSTGGPTDARYRVVVLDALDRAAVCGTLTARLPQAVPDLADTLSAALEQDGAVVVVMATPEQSLAAGLAATGDAAQALADWTAQQQDLLALQRRNRRRLTLVDAALLTRHEDADWPVLGRRLGGAAVQPGALLTLSPPDAAQATLRLAAIALGLRDAEAAAVIAELDAATLGRSRADETRVVLEAVQDWRNRSNELELLRENLAAQLDLNEQTSLESADQRRVVSSLEERLQAQLTERQTALEALAKAEKAAAALAERQALLETNITLQLGAADTLARQYALEAKGLQTAHEAVLKNALSEAAHARQMVQVEKAAREGLEALSRDTLSRREAVLGAQLLAQARSGAQQGGDLSRLERSLEAARNESVQLRGTLALVTEVRDGLDTQTQEQKSLIDALSQELDRVYGSKSWRLTGPLRAAMTRLGRS